MLRLRIERFAQNFFDENLATAGCRDDPNQNAEHERDRPKPRARADVVELVLDAAIS